MTHRVLFGERYDPTLNWIYDDWIRREQPVWWLDWRDIVSGLRMDDHISAQGNVELSWSVWGETLAPQAVDGGYSMLPYPDDTVFEEFTLEDREYVQAEYVAYMHFALAHVPRLINPPKGGSLCGASVSLPFQWMVVRRFDIDGVFVPRSYFGPIRDAPAALLSSPNVIVSDDVYGGRYWKTGRLPETNPTDPYLVYQRPFGKPLFTTVLFDDMWTTDTSIGRSMATPPRIEEVVRALRTELGLDSAHLLSFFDGQRRVTTFGSIAPGLDVALFPDDCTAAIGDALFRAVPGA